MSVEESREPAGRLGRVRRLPGRARRVAGGFRRRSAVRLCSPGPVLAAALDLRWRLDRGERDLLLWVEGQLEPTTAPVVAVLGAGRRNRFVGLLRAAYPQGRVVPVRPRTTGSALHVALAAVGPLDLILDDTRRPASRGSQFRRTFWHLRPGGALVAVDHVAQESGLPPGRTQSGLGATLRRLQRLAEVAELPASAGQARRDDHALAGALRTVTEVGGGHLAVVTGAAGLAKLSEREADQVLRRRRGPDRVLHTVEGVTFASRCRFTRSSGGRSRMMPDTYQAPGVALRDYRDALCVPGQVLVSGQLMLPDSFRHNQRKRLKNRFTHDVGPHFARLPDEVQAAPALSGTYFYLDDEVRGHFGHAMTEQLSRLWALPLAREAAPDLKAVLALNKGREIQPFEIEMYGAAGFAAEDLVMLREPTRMERVLAATPMLSMPQYIHPGIAETWSRMGDALAATAPDRDYPERMFVSRRLRKRACHNTPEVEALFAEFGFAVVYPEDYPMAEQVAMFQHAQVIAGFAGSGLFNICFASTPRTVVMVSHAAYTATNEYMMASVLGHDLVSVVSEPDRQRSADQPEVNTFQSSFTFDLEDEGHYLRGVLAAL